MTTRTVITLTEHESILSGEKTDLKATPKILCKEDFEQLKAFVFTESADTYLSGFNLRKKWTMDDTDNPDYLLQYTVSKQQERIKTKNYVGVIFLKSGTTIEILPKTVDEVMSDEDIKACKKTFLKILSVLTKSKSIRSGTANLETDKLPLFEHIIRMFITEAQRLQRYGFPSHYIEQKSNEHTFKGKLLIAQHIKHNFAHAERFYVQYDDYNINRPLNRLIKATLELLFRKSRNAANKKDLQRLIDALESVTASVNIEQDIAKVEIDRNIEEFRQIFEWCKIFLQKKSFTSFSGDTSAAALLFNMNKLFEEYTAVMLKKYLSDVTAQDSGYYLFDELKKHNSEDLEKAEHIDSNIFSLRPDIVIGKERGEQVVLDTKWKILNSGEANYKISQADMYQMYAYQKKYDARKVILLYPKQPAEDKMDGLLYSAESGNVNVEIRFVDLSMDDEGWEKFAESLIKEKKM